MIHVIGFFAGQAFLCWGWYRLGYQKAEREYRDHASREVEKAISTIRLRIEHAALGYGSGVLDRDDEDANR